MSLEFNREKKCAGFAGVNNGKISDCISISRFSRGIDCASFALDNSGSITDCFSRSKVGKKFVKPFVINNSGTVENSYMDIGDAQPDGPDSMSAFEYDFANTSVDELQGPLNPAFYIPECEDPKFADIDFDEESWHYEADLEYNPESAVVVSSANQLFEIAKQINDGDFKAASSVYVLDEDIDLGGKKWIPIGNESHPFKGVFDGNGHKVFNFKVCDKSLTFAGFFGFIEDALIANLQVDGVVKSGSCSGTFAGASKNSKIFCCSAVSYMKVRKRTGGFIGRNDGVIEKCAFYGKIKKAFPLWWWLLIPLLILGVLIYIYITNPYKNKAVFNNVPIDPYAVHTEDFSYEGGQNTVTFGFSDVINFKNGIGEFNLVNPGYSNQSMQLKVQITDSEMKEKTGSTGRTDAEQAEFDANPNYDPKNARIDICVSGLIPPGYQLPKLKLGKLPNGNSLPAGAYRAIAYLSFFDYQTNERAVINSQLPVLVVVE